MMKPCLILALATTLLACVANAQHSSQKITIGIKGGLSLYNIHINMPANFDTKAGFNAGLLAHIHIVPHIALQPEIYYSQQGSKGGGVNSLQK